MNKRFLFLVAVAAAVAAYLKRPIKQPEPTGVWGPAENKRASN